MSVAETVTPSVRGRTKGAVIAFLIAAGTGSAVLTGIGFWLLAGVVQGVLGFSPGPELLGPLAWILVAIGVGLDLVVLATGRPKPVANGRQVPREWGRWLSPPAVAVLYGARLGVGPLTMLSTWTWWSVTIAAAVMGLGATLAVASTFALVRLVVSVLFSELALARSHPGSFGRLRARHRPGWLTLNLVALTAVVAVVGSACSGGSTDGSAAGAAGAGGESASPAPTLGSEPLALKPLGSEIHVPDDGAGPPDALARVGSDQRPDEPDADPDSGIDPDADPTPVTRPAALEDFVRTDLVPADLAGADGSEAPPATPEALGTALIAHIDGFVLLNDPATNRFLDLESAAAIQPDPTEEVGLLETRGYQGGWTRAFRSTGNDVAVTSVYQFDDAAQAEFYLEDGLITIGGYGGTFFDIDGLPGVRGFTQDFTDGDEELVSLGAAFQHGPRWYLVYFVGSPETVTPDVLVPTVNSQLLTAAG